MTCDELLASIHADPDDDGLRLAYADALGASGMPQRAEWVRASCELAQIKYGDPHWHAAVQREMDTFRLCRPSWWEPLSNITQRNDRGLFRFVVGDSRSSRSATAFKRLGKVAWLGAAISEGWLLRVELDFCDDELVGIVGKWKEPASVAPLFVHPAPQAGDETLRTILRLPQLHGLHLETVTVRLPAVGELASYPNLTELKIELRNVEPAYVDAVLDQLLQLPNLRRLHLVGHDRIDYGNRPNDADLLRFKSSIKLKRIDLSPAPALTDVGIGEFRRLRPDVIVKR